MLQGSLSKFGHTVVTALSGSEGVTIFAETFIDVVICDLGMPEMNGWEVGKAVAAICEKRAIPGVPFILLTGWGGQVKETQMISECGVDAVLEKPVDVVELMEVIGKLTNRQPDESVHD
jgi:CheY-like chemotaxis protein